MLAITVSVRRGNFGKFFLSRFNGRFNIQENIFIHCLDFDDSWQVVKLPGQNSIQMTSNGKDGRALWYKTFMTENPGFLPGFRIFPDFFRPKPGQFHIDSGNLNFMKISWELAEEIVYKETYLVTHTTSGIYILIKEFTVQYMLLCHAVSNYFLLEYPLLGPFQCHSITSISVRAHYHLPYIWCINSPIAQLRKRDSNIVY